jgi:hypothetical protein
LENKQEKLNIIENKICSSLDKIKKLKKKYTKKRGRKLENDFLELKIKIKKKRKKEKNDFFDLNKIKLIENEPNFNDFFNRKKIGFYYKSSNNLILSQFIDQYS